MLDVLKHQKNIQSQCYAKMFRIRKGRIVEHQEREGGYYENTECCRRNHKIILFILHFTVGLISHDVVI